jgi:hypothetical protein
MRVCERLQCSSAIGSCASDGFRGDRQKPVAARWQDARDAVSSCHTVPRKAGANPDRKPAKKVIRPILTPCLHDLGRSLGLIPFRSGISPQDVRNFEGALAEPCPRGSACEWRARWGRQVVPHLFARLPEATGSCSPYDPRTRSGRIRASAVRSSTSISASTA